MVTINATVILVLETFIFQIWEPLKKSFGRVIAADMLGLGFSDKPVSDFASGRLEFLTSQHYNLIQFEFTVSVICSASLAFVL